LLVSEYPQRESAVPTAAAKDILIACTAIKSIAFSFVLNYNESDKSTSIGE
jgi:hypothetical protein